MAVLMAVLTSNIFIVAFHTVSKTLVRAGRAIHREHRLGRPGSKLQLLSGSCRVGPLRNVSVIDQHRVARLGHSIIGGDLCCRVRR